MTIDIWAHDNEDNSRNMSNFNFKELFEMLEIEFDWSGEIVGINLVSFIEKLKALQSIVQRNEKEFSTPEIRNRGALGALNIYPARHAEYWERVINKILNISESTTKVYWG